MSDLVLPYAVIAALWLPRASSAPEAVLSALSEDGESHLIEIPGAGTWPLTEVLSRLRDEPVDDVGALLPSPGRVAGVPAVVLDRATENEQLLLIRSGDRGIAVVPAVESFGSDLEPGTLVRWRAIELPVSERPVRTLLGSVGNLGEARRDLTEALIASAEALERIDVTSWNDDAGTTVADLLRAELPAHLLPAGLEPRRIEVLARAARLLAIVEAAREDGGGSLTTHHDGARRDALTTLEATARRALAAASISVAPPRG